MAFGTESHGTIRYQVGRCLDFIRLNIEQEDVAGVINHTKHLETIASPLLDGTEVPGFSDRAKREGTVAFEEAQTIQKIILKILSEKGIYAYLEQEIGDASEIALE